MENITLVPITDEWKEGFDAGYEKAITDCENIIKHHFGTPYKGVGFWLLTQISTLKEKTS